MSCSVTSRRVLRRGHDRAGRFDVANGGTLFLDEVGELPLNIQAKLLRTLQNGEIQRLGADRPLHVDVRIIAACTICRTACATACFAPICITGFRCIRWRSHRCANVAMTFCCWPSTSLS